MNRVQIEASVLSMFNRCNESDKERFIETVLDLLVQLKEFAENSDIFYQQQKDVSSLNIRQPLKRPKRSKPRTSLPTST